MRIKCKKWEMKVTTERVIDHSYWFSHSFNGSEKLEWERGKSKKRNRTNHNGMTQKLMKTMIRKR